MLLIYTIAINEEYIFNIYYILVIYAIIINREALQRKLKHKAQFTVR